MTKQYLVIYYDGNEFHCGVLSSDYPDSSAPHVWGLPSNYDIIAVIEGFNPNDFQVWIGEEVALNSGTATPF